MNACMHASMQASKLASIHSIRQACMPSPVTKSLMQPSIYCRMKEECLEAWPTSSFAVSISVGGHGSQFTAINRAMDQVFGPVSTVPYRQATHVLTSESYFCPSPSNLPAVTYPRSLFLPTTCPQISDCPGLISLISIPLSSISRRTIFYTFSVSP